jgi:hypothetical protein
MNLSLPFVTQPKRKKKNNKPETTRIIKIHNEYTPIEIQNMTMPELEYLYEHGTPTQKEIAEHVMITRKKFEIATMVPDDILASGAPTSSGSPSSGLRW